MNNPQHNEVLAYVKSIDKRVTILAEKVDDLKIKVNSEANAVVDNKARLWDSFVGLLMGGTVTFILGQVLK